MYNKKNTLKRPNEPVHLSTRPLNLHRGHAESFICIGQRGDISAQTVLQVTLMRIALDLRRTDIMPRDHLFGASIDGQTYGELAKKTCR